MIVVTVVTVLKVVTLVAVVRVVTKKNVSSKKILYKKLLFSFKKNPKFFFTKKNPNCDETQSVMKLKNSKSGETQELKL